MQVTFDQGELDALMAALRSYLSGLREEIGKTDNYDLREKLHAHEAALMGIVSKIGGTLPIDRPELGANNPPWGKV
jgi:hypothetical protein